jgi:hypothetical protein
MGSTVDISENSRELLRELAEKTGQTTCEVLEKALDAYRRQVFFDKVNAGYAELRADPQAWDEFQADQKEWDDAPIDNLEHDEHWSEDGQCAPETS